MAFLEVHEPGFVARSVRLNGNLRIGRDDDNDLSLLDDRVSRRHLEIVAEHGAFVARDLGSTHGVRVNGASVQSHRLMDGDRLQVGNTRLLFRASDDPHATIEVQRTSPMVAAAAEPADRRLRLFYEISTKIGKARDGELFVREMVDGLRRILKCDRVVVGLGQTAHKGFRSIARDDQTEDDVVVGPSVLDAVLTHRQRVVFVENDHADAYPTMVRRRIHAAVCLPIATATTVYGFLYVDERREGRNFTPDDEHFLAALAHLAAGVLEAAEHLRETEARAAAIASSQKKHRIVGASKGMTDLYKRIERCATSSEPVLIQGESGTGKELVAKALHQLSKRSAAPRIDVNCAAIPDNMIEAELFGYKRGAFTGATHDHEGYFVAAHKGTLFLDEIGDLALTAQAKLLRTLQEGEVRPLGSTQVIRVDVRFIAATHKNLSREIAEGRFREDLYFRLSALRLEVPPLRKRDKDVEVLVRELLPEIGAKAGKRISGLTPRAMEALSRYHWPGNVRELINVLHYAVTFSETPMIDSEDLGEFALPSDAKPPTGQTGPGSLEERYAALPATEKQLIVEALEKSKGNISAAARLLGISWIMLRRRMTRFGLMSDAEDGPK